MGVNYEILLSLPCLRRSGFAQAGTWGGENYFRTYYKKIPLDSLSKRRQGDRISQKKDLNEIVNGLKRLVQFFRIGPSCLRKIRTTSSGSSNMKSNLFNQLIGIETMGEV